MATKRFSRRRPDVLICLPLAALWAWGGSGGTLRAELAWKETTVELHPDAKADVVEARFHFANTGTAPVDIQEIQTSCGCTTAALEQRHYGPGEGGEIVARYTVGEHVGPQEKTVLVSSSDGKEATLTLLVHLPEWLHVEPATLAWKHGAAATARTIELTASPPTLRFDEVSVQASSTRVATVLRPLVEGKKYELQVTPDATDQPAFVTLNIRARSGTKAFTFRAYATVELPMPAPGVPFAAQPPTDDETSAAPAK